MCLTPDGAWVMSGSKDRGVQFWDPVTGNAQMMLQGHKNSGESIVSLLAFSHSNHYSHLGCTQPYWQPVRDRQWRHACPYLEVSDISPTHPDSDHKLTRVDTRNTRDVRFDTELAQCVFCFFCSKFLAYCRWDYAISINSTLWCAFEQKGKKQNSKGRV